MRNTFDWFCSDGECISDSAPGCFPLLTDALTLAVILCGYSKNHVRNEEVLLRVKEQRNILHEIRKRNHSVENEYEKQS
jgi:biotin synthase-related radical SAM superfamily protein